MLSKRGRGKESSLPGRKPPAAARAERRRSASDLHDECGGLLSVLQFKMEALKHNLPQNPFQFREQADQIITLLARLSDNVRSTFSRLGPATVEPFNLVLTLGQFLQEYAGQWPGVEIDFQADEFPEPLPLGVGLTLFRICQEALSKAAGHAGTKRIEIRLERDEHWVVLSVKDGDGEIGPEAAGVRGKGIQRSDLYGARACSTMPEKTFEMLSVPGVGIRVRLPLNGDKTK